MSRFIARAANFIARMLLCAFLMVLAAFCPG